MQIKIYNNNKKIFSIIVKILMKVVIIKIITLFKIIIGSYPLNLIKLIYKKVTQRMIYKKIFFCQRKGI